MGYCDNWMAELAGNHVTQGLEVTKDIVGVMGDSRIEALDNSLFDKLQVFDGDISPMLKPDNNAIANTPVFLIPLLIFFLQSPVKFPQPVQASLLASSILFLPSIFCLF